MAKKTKTIDAPVVAQDTSPETWTEITADAPVAVEAVSEPGPKKTRKPKADAPKVEQPASEPPVVVATVVEPASEPKPAKKAKRAKSDATLQDVFAGYVAGLEAEGKSDGTIASYRMELALAADALGLETKIVDITPERVLLFFTSDRVTKKRNGKPKSPLSIDKTRRVLRQALTWAQTAKLIAEAPLPELVASH